MGITWLETTESTNRDIKRAISEGKPERTAIAAFEQRGGYGRQGRIWNSPQGGIYLSLLLRPYDHKVVSEAMPSLAPAISLAVKRLLVTRGLEAHTRIKWPNDILVLGKKISGISVELVEGAVCVGIGLNVFDPKEGRTPTHKIPDQGKYKLTYLADLIEGVPDGVCVSSGFLRETHRRFIQNTADCLLCEVYSVYEQWLMRGFACLKNEYLACSALQGKTVCLLFLSGDVLYEGRVCDIDDQGSLVLECDDGQIVHASSGEVHIV